jgi:hypothetical protein
MPACLFRYNDQTVTALEGRRGRYIIYLGIQPVTTITRIDRNVWRKGRQDSRTLTEAAYRWLQDQRGSICIP